MPKQSGLYLRLVGCDSHALVLSVCCQLTAHSQDVPVAVAAADGDKAMQAATDARQQQKQQAQADAGRGSTDQDAMWGAGSGSKNQDSSRNKKKAMFAVNEEAGDAHVMVTARVGQDSKVRAAFALVLVLIRGFGLRQGWR